VRRWFTFAATTLMAISGCRQDAPPALPDATSAEQGASFIQTFAPADRVAAQTLAFFAAAVVSGPGLSAGDPSSREMRHTPGTLLNIGAAVQVDHRGYFVTAAHLVGPDPILVLTPTDDGTVVRPARLVYCGHGDFDFAVLFAPGPVLPGIGWVSGDALVPGTPLVGAGLAHAPSPGLTMQAYAGRLIRTESAVGPDGPYQRLVGTLPAHHGDSGGPQYAFPPIGHERGLAGVTIAVRPLPGGQWESCAIRPDLAWLDGVIDTDQRTLAALGPTTRP
jgi:S1-C subfamily serine protease